MSRVHDVMATQSAELRSQINATRATFPPRIVATLKRFAEEYAKKYPRGLPTPWWHVEAQATLDAYHASVPPLDPETEGRLFADAVDRWRGCLP